MSIEAQRDLIEARLRQEFELNLPTAIVEAERAAFDEEIVNNPAVTRIATALRTVINVDDNDEFVILALTC